MDIGKQLSLNSRLLQVIDSSLRVSSGDNSSVTDNQRSAATPRTRIDTDLIERARFMQDEGWTIQIEQCHEIENFRDDSEVSAGSCLEILPGGEYILRRWYRGCALTEQFFGNLECSITIQEINNIAFVRL